MYLAPFLHSATEREKKKTVKSVFISNIDDEVVYYVLSAELMK